MSIANLLAGAKAGGAGKKAAEGVICTDPAILEMAGQFLTAKGRMEEAEAAKKQVEAVLKPRLLRVWLAGNAGRPTPESSVRLFAPVGNPPVPTRMTASFAAQWYPAATADLAAMGVPPDMVRKKLSLTIDGDEIPADKTEAVVAGIMQVLSDAGCVGALTYKYADYPKPEFAAARHTRLTPEQNEALETAGLNTRVSIK